jgi:hypothetical protein
MKALDNLCLQRSSQAFPHKLRYGFSQGQGPALGILLGLGKYVIIQAERRSHTLMMTCLDNDVNIAY